MGYTPLDLTSAAETQGRSVGFQFNLDALDAIRGNIDIHLFPGGYAGVVGLGGNSFNLCLAVDKQRLPQERQVEFFRNRCYRKTLICENCFSAAAEWATRGQPIRSILNRGAA